MKKLLQNLDLSLRLGVPPYPLVLVVLILAMLPMVFFAKILLARSSKMEQPRIHLWQDMDHSVALKAQEASTTFADGRAMRPQVPGTVARGMLKNDDHLYRGFEVDADGNKVTTNIGGLDESVWYTTYPDAITVDAKLLDRGQAVYQVFCFTCHGADGKGQGPTHLRAELLTNRNAEDSSVELGMNWVAPTNITLPAYYTANYPHGKLYNTIVHGKGNMKGYGSSIPDAEDRWAVVAYVRALQLAQDAEQVLEPPQ